MQLNQYFLFGRNFIDVFGSPRANRIKLTSNVPPVDRLAVFSKFLDRVRKAARPGVVIDQRITPQIFVTADRSRRQPGVVGNDLPGLHAGLQPPERASEGGREV